MSEVYREYEPHEWSRNEPITADKLNNIEQGIDALDGWVQGVSASAETFANGRDIGSVTLNGVTTNLQIPPSNKTEVSVNPDYTNGIQIATLTIDGVDTDIKIPNDESEPYIIVNEMTAADTDVTILPLPNTYEWPEMTELTITLTADKLDQEYHFCFTTSSTGCSPFVINGITEAVGAIQASHNYEVNIWNGIAVVLDRDTTVEPETSAGNTKSSTYLNTVVPTTAWTAMTAPGSGQSDPFWDAGFRYTATITASGIDSSYVPIVNFDIGSATSGNFAPAAIGASNGIVIYAIEAPLAALTIPSIICLKD